MKISIILPCYNMENYIESTLLSIVNQKYDDLELIVVDGGSTDNTLSILDKYAENITVLISEPDNGQYHAVSKGMDIATGEILAWINADDVYFPWTFEHVSLFFRNYPEESWISGCSSLMEKSGLMKNLNQNIIAKPKKLIENGWFRDNMYGFLQQEGMFWRKELWDKSGGLDESLKLATDFKLWIQFIEHAELVSFGIPLAAFRNRDDSRSVLQKTKYDEEVKSICRDLKKPFFLKRMMGSTSLLMNIFMRKTTIRKGKIYYYSPSNKKWLLAEKRTTMSVHTLTKIISLH